MQHGMVRVIDEEWTSTAFQKQHGNIKPTGTTNLEYPRMS
jgi:hypothetical protein